MAGKTQTEAELFAALARVDTPTVCNALEVVHGARSDSGFTRQTMIAAVAAAFVGRARTATIRATRRAGAPAGVEHRLDYFRYITGARDGDGGGSPGDTGDGSAGRGDGDFNGEFAAGDNPGDSGDGADSNAATVVVIEDLDSPPGVGAFWGEVHSAVHAALGVAGVVTNGAVRDLDALHPGLPILAGAVTPSHAFVDTEALDVPVTIFGMTVAPGAIVHADRHGAVVIPDAALAELPAAVATVTRREAGILQAARSAGLGKLRLDDLATALYQSRAG